MVLKQLKQLKLLELHHNVIEHEFTLVEIPEDVRKALVNCETLV